MLRPTVANAMSVTFAAHARHTNPTEAARFLLGGWHANGNFLGGDRRFGVWWGGEVELVRDRLSVEADCVSGHQQNGATSVGAKIMFTDDVSVTLRAQIPNPGGAAKWEAGAGGGRRLPRRVLAVRAPQTSMEVPVAKGSRRAPTVRSTRRFVLSFEGSAR